MRLMGLEAIYPKRRTTRPAPGHTIYPYLLRDLEITRPDQVWASDITYVPLRRGFLYLVAVMDWFSRYVLSWRLSNTLEGSFCVEALEEALGDRPAGDLQHRPRVAVHGNAFTGRLETYGIAISMDGRGRALDNVFVERLWRTVKYEEVYLRDYADGWEAERSLGAVLRVLSRGENPSVVGVSHAGGRVWRQWFKATTVNGRKSTRSRAHRGSEKGILCAVG